MEKLTTKPNITLKQAMKKLNQGGEKCLVIIDNKNTLLGTLSDGDLRKAILDGVPFNDSIEKVYQKNPTFLFEGGLIDSEIKNIFIKNRHDLIPVTNKDMILVDIILWEKVFSQNEKKRKIDNKVPVVIMAGGKGTRLEPFTKILPKPLIPVHDKPIIEHIIERFTDIGCTSFNMVVNYKARILKAYFEELQPNYKISFIDEVKPLGTAGSLSLLSGQFDKPFFVSNCDIIIKADYASMYEFHKKGGYDVTLIASAKEYIIPYGTCKLNKEGHLAYIKEKPHYDFLINAGLYILNPEVLELVPENKFFHITHLIENVISRDKKVGVFPISDDAWVDVGEWVEYNKAVDNL